ncbi:MAG: hypothetical protein JKY30_08845 [Flavobacteriales bacterium]|nr:hypothetical protein [Flavobacteriales bacterium]
MTTYNENNADLNSENLVVFFYKWRKPLLILSLLAIIISTATAFLVKEKYSSSVILYPTVTSSISKALIAENYNGKDDILKFGEKEEAEQMLQILNSDDIRNRIIEKYNLMNHYGIDESDNYPRTKLENIYESNITVDMTRFMAVEIEVLDYNPDTAALIANDIAALLDTVKNRMRREIAVEAFAIVANRYNDQKNYVQALEDSLTSLRRLGVIDYESQAERITEQLSIAILQGKSNAVRALEGKLVVLVEYGGAYVSIRDQLEYEKKQLTFIHSKYEEAKIDAESNLQHKFIVNHAYKAEKSSYPLKWLIVLVSTVATFLITLMALLFVESFKNAKNKLK